MSDNKQQATTAPATHVPCESPHCPWPAIPVPLQRAGSQQIRRVPQYLIPGPAVATFPIAHDHHHCCRPVTMVQSDSSQSVPFCIGAGGASIPDVVSTIAPWLRAAGRDLFPVEIVQWIQWHWFRAVVACCCCSCCC